MSDQVLQLTFPAPDVAWLAFDQPGKSMNVLSRSVLAELSLHFDSLATRLDLKGLVIASHKPNCFLAGADIKEISHSLRATKRAQIAIFQRGQQLFRRLSQFPFATVAVVRGICLGGGAELAAWCDARVFSQEENTEFGFPEVKLGLIPGWGGTVRMPRMIGLPNAVELITSGESISAARAQALGIADDCVAPDQLTATALSRVSALQYADCFLRRRQQWEQPVAMLPVEKKFLQATTQAKLKQETQGHYPVPFAVLELMLGSAERDIDTALMQEAEVMGQCLGSPVNLALLNVFHATDKLKKTGQRIGEQSLPQAWRQVGVVGAGIMGSSIAATFVKRGIHTTLVDAASEALEKAWPDILDYVSYDKSQRRANSQLTARFMPLLQSTTHLESLAPSELVVEAIVETATAKANLFSSLEAIVSPSAIIASNTSTLSVTSMAANLQNPERFCGLHFFNPVRRMKLVEVIYGQQTSEQTIVQAANLMRRIGKFPLLVKDSPGFLVNRILSPYLNAALELLSLGVTIAEVDRQALQFGMPIGPLALYDLVGFDTALHAGRTMWEAFPNRFTASPILPALMKAGRLGQKNGQGFYRYVSQNPTPRLDPVAEQIVSTYIKTKLELSPDQITWRLILPMLMEAVRTLEEGIVSDPREVDAGLIYGLGFPAFRGGLLFWADQQGAHKLQEIVESCAATGKAVAQPALWNELLSSQRKFYDLATEGRPQ